MERNHFFANLVWHFRKHEDAAVRDHEKKLF